METLIDAASRGTQYVLQETDLEPVSTTSDNADDVYFEAAMGDVQDELSMSLGQIAADELRGSGRANPHAHRLVKKRSRTDSPRRRRSKRQAQTDYATDNLPRAGDCSFMSSASAASDSGPALDGVHGHPQLDSSFSISALDRTWLTDPSSAMDTPSFPASAGNSRMASPRLPQFSDGYVPGIGHPCMHARARVHAASGTPHSHGRSGSRAAGSVAGCSIDSGGDDCAMLSPPSPPSHHNTAGVLFVSVQGQGQGEGRCSRGTGVRACGSGACSPSSRSSPVPLMKSLPVRVRQGTAERAVLWEVQHARLQLGEGDVQGYTHAHAELQPGSIYAAQTNACDRIDAVISGLNLGEGSAEVAARSRGDRAFGASISSARGGGTAVSQYLDGAGALAESGESFAASPSTSPPPHTTASASSHSTLRTAPATSYSPRQWVYGGAGGGVGGRPGVPSINPPATEKERDGGAGKSSFSAVWKRSSPGTSGHQPVKASHTLGKPQVAGQSGLFTTAAHGTLSTVVQASEALGLKEQTHSLSPPHAATMSASRGWSPAATPSGGMTTFLHRPASVASASSLGLTGTSRAASRTSGGSPSLLPSPNLCGARSECEKGRRRRTAAPSSTTGGQDVAWMAELSAPVAVSHQTGLRRSAPSPVHITCRAPSDVVSIPASVPASAPPVPAQEFVCEGQGDMRHKAADVEKERKAASGRERGVHGVHTHSQQAVVGRPTGVGSGYACPRGGVDMGMHASQPPHGAARRNVSGRPTGAGAAAYGIAPEGQATPSPSLAPPSPARPMGIGSAFRSGLRLRMRAQVAADRDVMSTSTD